METIIVYWSMTGNTERLAAAVAGGVKAAGGSAAIKTVGEIDAKSVAAYDKILLGCPAMGAEALEEGDFQPFYDAAEPLLKGKKVGFFGTYDWGDGEWMRNWQAQAIGAGIDLVDALAVQQDDGALELQGETLGKKFA